MLSDQTVAQLQADLPKHQEALRQRLRAGQIRHGNPQAKAFAYLGEVLDRSIAEEREKAHWLLMKLEPVWAGEFVTDVRLAHK